MKTTLGRGAFAGAAPAATTVSKRVNTALNARHRSGVYSHRRRRGSAGVGGDDSSFMLLKGIYKLTPPCCLARKADVADFSRECNDRFPGERVQTGDISEGAWALASRLLRPLHAVATGNL